MSPLPQLIHTWPDPPEMSVGMPSLRLSCGTCAWGVGGKVRDQLRAWREDNTRHSEEVVDMWEYCLKHYKTKLGDERTYTQTQA
ncbi:ER membrane protein complex subunit 2 [Portunus trituberculatus]|uniref:ER membrane protein complex subunit 2 n=1 Tax=Portunus trituberculatus TaxID=210409 RepID=A0A5B7EMM5_PORTR|nr:ER membrane protein complex subunit 2 [Portunus trituberculatus]